MMKNKLIKLQIVSLAVFFVLGTSALAYGVPLPATNNKMVSNYVMFRNFPHKHVTIPHIQQPQATATTSISLPTNAQGSKNWAGYVVSPASGSSYKKVSGSWTVPNIKASQQNSVAAQWIGLGGVSSDDLLQMGTVEQIENGQAVAEVFWEQLPAPAQNVMTVPIGSTISATISKAADSSSTWNLTFTVNGQTQTQAIPPVTLTSDYETGIGTSAEWISEDPSTQDGQLCPLADMGTVSYRSAMVDDQLINSSNNTVQPIALVSGNGNILIAPSALGTDGKSFSTNVVNTNTTTRPAQGFRRKALNSRGYPVNNLGWNWGC